MVTLLEWKSAHDYTVFENKDNHKRIIKTLMKENISKIEKQMMFDYGSKGEVPTSENVHRIQDLVASILENFEIVDIKTTKETEEGIPIPDNQAKPIKSKEGVGEFCYKCGLQKLETKIVEKEDTMIRMCEECLGI